MNPSSMDTFSKISFQMEKLSQIISQEQMFRQQLQDALHRSSSDSEESGLQNIDAFVRQYDNPTTKSLPFDEQAEASSQLFEQNSETINTIYRNYPNQQSMEEQRDDKSTVIEVGLKGVVRKEEIQIPSPQSSIPNYSTLEHSKPLKLQKHSVKQKKTNSKNATESITPDYRWAENHQFQNNFCKTSSLLKGKVAIESPAPNYHKGRKGGDEHEGNILKDIRGKVGKVARIDRVELSKLQEKKHGNKVQLSSTRKKTKRMLGNAKSTTNMTYYGKLATSTSKFLMKKNNSNTSCKKFEGHKKEMVRKDERLPNYQDWQRMEKTHKKLNRVNICKLQENMKKVYDKKNPREVSTNQFEKRNKKPVKFQSCHKEESNLQLNFTEDIETTMRRLIQEKELNRQYSKETNRYLEASKKMSKEFFGKLMRECRETSEEAVLKIKLVTLILYFFDQFSEVSLLSTKLDPNSDQFFRRVEEEEIISILLHPKKLIRMVQDLPSMLMNDNILSAERISIFVSKLGEINEQLDQQLQFFLIKKEAIYQYIHSLSEYVDFLVRKELIAQTKRTKIMLLPTKQPLHGFYSSRSKRQEVSNKYIRKNETGNRTGFRCDSDRKITLEDEQLYAREREVLKNNRKQSTSKGVQSKRVFK